MLRFIFLVLILLAPLHANAQDSGSGCNPNQIGPTYARQLLEATTFEELQAASDALEAVLLACEPAPVPTVGDTLFEIESSVTQEIIGPITFPAGYYVLEYEFDETIPGAGYFQMDWANPDYMNFMGFLNQIVPSGRYAIWIDNPGQFYANVEAVSISQWRITIRPLLLEGGPNELHLSGTGDVADIAGPVTVDGGTYVLEYKAARDGEVIFSVNGIPEATGHSMLPGISGDSRDADIQGREAFELDAGTYVFNYEIYGVGNWEIHLTKLSN